ncbi:hypothetical protein Nepgr_013188 [Nepenthes gracilis]|uniref:Uncharacterized protein n=1 Tax=Nepenthes gracilis TaxID=150966 RepID=A0AAD3SHM7_NEPGR|nr:hypothetical protein Nepgr_013188 [Nepenthes gracilis]
MERKRVESSEEAFGGQNFEMKGKGQARHIFLVSGRPLRRISLFLLPKTSVSHLKAASPPSIPPELWCTRIGNQRDKIEEKVTSSHAD